MIGISGEKSIKQIANKRYLSAPSLWELEIIVTHKSRLFYPPYSQVFLIFYL